uniref:CX domain-containing protein n=1 Tax=Panagrellus redivivus TaxID=6233 RepID=A0A7E4V673_PANRE
MTWSPIYWVFCWPYRILRPGYRRRPLASDVLTAYIRKRAHPSWTSYFVAYREVNDDHFGEKHFNFAVDGHNYHILRTGCYPYIKYHCTQRPFADLTSENRLFQLITVANLGIPCLLYGLAAIGLIRHVDHVVEPRSNVRVNINFLILEDHQ